VARSDSGRAAPGRVLRGHNPPWSLRLLPLPGGDWFSCLALEQPLLYGLRWQGPRLGQICVSIL